ncbi:MAG: PEP-CTERM sorting domain-containing protein [Candidatus Omnitrophica bacterium]|nr:PEP-CTERM sorting domain-containing protein [Candidatus Omnitrophota bacterium]
MKKLYLVLLVCILSFGLSTPAFAQFINGGFEDGNFTGWTQNGGRYNWGGTYSYSGDPGRSAIVGAGTDPYTGGNLSTVYSGNYSARINNYDNRYHFSTITQDTVWNDSNIYFAWAAVIQDPGHIYPGHMRVTLNNLTDSTSLYDFQIDYYNQSGATWHTYNDWGYTDWNVVQLDTSAHLGDTLRLSILASDCGAGGHGGYAYLDGFGAVAPPQGDDNPVPEPMTMLLFGPALLGLVGLKRRKA